MDADDEQFETMSCPPALHYRESCEFAARWAGDPEDDDVEVELVSEISEALRIASSFT